MVDGATLWGPRRSRPTRSAAWWAKWARLGSPLTSFMPYTKGVFTHGKKCGGGAILCRPRLGEMQQNRTARRSRHGQPRAGQKISPWHWHVSGHFAQSLVPSPSLGRPGVGNQSLLCWPLSTTPHTPATSRARAQDIVWTQTTGLTARLAKKALKVPCGNQLLQKAAEMLVCSFWKNISEVFRMPHRKPLMKLQVSKPALAQTPEVSSVM